MTRLVVVTACKDAQFAIKGLLSRSPLALGFVPPTEKEIAWPVDTGGKDSGILRNAEGLLTLYKRTEAKALVVFDHEGSNAKLIAPEAETKLEERLAKCGFAGRCRVVVIEPELEQWVWAGSPQVDEALGWGGRTPPLREWMTSEELLAEDALKPQRPKEAMEKAMARAGKARSSSVFRQLGEKVSFARCEDRAFLRLIETLRGWFPRA